MRLVMAVVCCGVFATEASAQICEAHGDATIVAGPDGVLDRLATLTGTVVGVDEGERTDDFEIDETPPCGPCMEDATPSIFSGTYHSYLFQYLAAVDAPADATFIVANDAQAVILDIDSLFQSDDPGLVPALLRMAPDRSTETDDIVSVNGRTITLHFEAALLRGLDHVRVLTLTGGECSPTTPDAGGGDAGALPAPDGGAIATDGGSSARDATTGGRDDAGTMARRDSGSTAGRPASYQFEGGGGCACRASGGDATLAPLLVLFLLARSRRRDSR